MNKVGGSVNGVDDPGGLVGEDTGLPCSHRLLPNEPETHTENTHFKVFIYVRVLKKKIKKGHQFTQSKEIVGS